MSLRPAVRREGPLDQALLTMIVILLGATFMLWLTGQVSGFVNSGKWPKVSLPEMGVVVTGVPRHPLDPAAAWPQDARQLLPGPVPGSALMLGQCGPRSGQIPTLWITGPGP